MTSKLTPTEACQQKALERAAKMNGIIINGKVYELSVNTDPDVCERCALSNGNSCEAPHWLNCNCITLKFSKPLTAKLNK